MKLKIALAFILLASATAWSHQGISAGMGRPWDDPDHMPMDPYVKDYYRGPECTIKKNGKVFRLNEPAGTLEKALALLDMTASGHKLLKKYSELNKKAPYQFEELDYNTRRAMGFPTRVGAAYVFDGKSKTIYADTQDDLGLLVIFMAHELTHAVDFDVPTSFFQETEAAKRLSKDDYVRLRQKNSFRIERRAFDMQDKIYPELTKLADCYEPFLQKHRDEAGLKLTSPTPDSYIKSAYGIP